jgi:hypothetical protein
MVLRKVRGCGKNRERIVKGKTVEEGTNAGLKSWKKAGEGAVAEERGKRRGEGDVSEERGKRLQKSEGNKKKALCRNREPSNDCLPYENLRLFGFVVFGLRIPETAKYYQNCAKAGNVKSRICEGHANKELSK